MTNTPEPSTLPLFFTRNGLGAEDLETCLAVARRASKKRRVEVLEQQGYCSFTVLCCGEEEEEEQGKRDAERKLIVQFRSPRYALSPDVARAARRVYGDLAPAVKGFGKVGLGAGAVEVQVCVLGLVEGVAVGRVLPRRRGLGREEGQRLEGLLRGMARLFVRGWEGSGRKECRGRVGRSVLGRLAWLERRLPSCWLRRRAGLVRKGVEGGGLEALPVVFTHGDVLPSNILVDFNDWHLHGLVDWAEAEDLPFGMAFYGIEHLLGYLDPSSGRYRFVYYQRAMQLRESFWQELLKALPDLRQGHLREAMLLAREVGILLWHGIAFDDGKLDRVINATDDRQEVAYLEAFLGHAGVSATL